MIDGSEVVLLIDRSVVENAEDGRRAHLGASLIGRKCNRELWYSFRWAANKNFSGRLYRLFDRGHEEEFRFVEYLRQIGCEVREYSEALWWHEATNVYQSLPWDTQPGEPWEHVTQDRGHVMRAEAQGVEPKQWRIKDVKGHFGGSSDGRALNVPFITPEQEVLLEFKTHGTKSFCKLLEARDRLKSPSGALKEVKPEHWAQMQVYMYKQDLPVGLYMAVNKNDDDLYVEYVAAEPQAGIENLAKAERIISSPTPPARLWSNASNWDCKFCDFILPCHFGKALEKNCRTCTNSIPIEDGEWYCTRWDANIPLAAQKVGCDNWRQIND